MTDLISQQVSRSSPSVEGTIRATSPMVPPPRAADRLRHLTPEVYDLTPASHLSRLLKVLLGDAGIGQVRKRTMLARLQQTIQGSHFFDLDRFYGALFDTRRRSYERLSVNPHGGIADAATWDAEMAKDASYRSRVEQFARAISFGATPTGMELAAEALLNVDCDIYESFVVVDRSFETYGEIEAAVGTYGGAENFTYGELESLDTTPDLPEDRYQFTVRPKRPITQEEAYDVRRVLRALKPAFTRLFVDSGGMGIHREGGLRGLTADSEFWEVRQSVIPRPEVNQFYTIQSPDGRPVEQPRPPFSGYQGEAWTYNSDILGVVGWSEVNGIAVPGSEQTMVLYIRPSDPLHKVSYVNFFPRYAIQPLQNTEAGRAVSDAILVAHPYSRPRTNTPGVGIGDVLGSYLQGTVSSLWTDDRILHSAAATWMKTNFQPTDQSRHWATHDKAITDSAREIVEVRYGTPRLINHISYEFSRYPALVTIEAWDEDHGIWKLVHSQSVADSVPKRIQAGWASYGPFHIQHIHVGHWIETKQKIEPVLTSKMRFVMQRNPLGIGPTDDRGRPFPYSLGLRNVDFGYRVAARGDIPLITSTISQTRDILGSLKQMDLYEEKAADLLVGKQWRSEPQPVSDAVVNLYADARTPGGDGQVFDRFYVDPLHQGVHLTLYHSDDEPEGVFTASDDPLRLGVVGVTGTVTPTENGLYFGPGDNWIDVPNEVLQWDHTKSWTIYGNFIPSFASTDASPRTLFAFGSTNITFNPSDFGFNVNTMVRFVVSYDAETLAVATWVKVEGQDGFTYTYAVDTPSDIIDGGSPTDTSTAVIDGGSPSDIFTAIIDGGASPVTSSVPINDPRLEHFRIGSALDGSQGFEGYISSLMVKANIGISQSDGDAAVEDLPGHVLKPLYAPDGDHTTDNAILRYHPSHTTDDNLYGLVGGPGDQFASLNWSPVARDFVLQTGFIQLPPIKARFWKFEFTNLAAQPYESFVPITRRIKTFPIGVIRETTLRQAIPTNSRGYFWNWIAIPQSPFRLYADDTWNPRVTMPPGEYSTWAATNVEITETTRDGGVTSTSAMVVEDISLASNLALRGSFYSFQTYQQGTLAPRFTEVGPHTYQETVVQHSSKVAFFVGLKELRAYRVEYVSDDDTTVYRDHFWDDSNMELPYTWELDPNRLYSDATPLPAVATSRVFESNHSVEAVQFATQQNEAIQIIPDDRFRDPILTVSDFTNQASWHTLGDAKATYSALDTIVRLDRRPPPPALRLKGEMEHGVERPLPIPVFSERPSAPDSTGDEQDDHGGFESPEVVISADGRIHAALRFKAITDLTAPLHLQIIDAEGNVLASKAISAGAGETVEEYVTYVINSYVPDYQRLDSQWNPPRSIMDEPQQPVFTDPPLTFVGPPPPPPETADDVVRVRVIQYGLTNDAVDLDALSLFDESIVWEFSVDGGATWLAAHGVRNFVNGILSFNDPGRYLRWRTTAYRENMNVTGLQIRPHYRGMTALRTTGHFRGPNVSTFDQEPPIQDDPEFSLWSKPVPRRWFLSGQNFPTLPIDINSLTNEFSSFFGRSAEDDIEVTLTETVTRQHLAQRYGTNSYNPNVIPQQVPGEPVPAAVDAGTRSSITTRSGTEVVPEPIEGVEVQPGGKDAINQSPDHPLSVGGMRLGFDGGFTRGFNP